MSHTMRLVSLSRSTTDGSTETLQFKPGINAIVGLPNSGKTKWLQMLDFVLGDADSPENAFGEELAEKYDQISALVVISDTEVHLERKWKEPGRKTKICIDKTWVTADEFSTLLLRQLATPELHFPKGNPYAERSWPTLSWRMILRQIYRQERFWADIADLQPEIEQFAVLAQFLGLAEHLFPQELGSVIDKRREIYKLQARKEQYQSILDQVSSEILEAGGNSIVVTPDLLDDRIQAWYAAIQELNQQREIVLQNMTDGGAQRSESLHTDVTIGKRRIEVGRELTEVQGTMQTARRRLADLEQYRNTVIQEIDRLTRAQSSANYLADLKVTHCPACDQELSGRPHVEGVCYVCGQPTDEVAADRRLEFEQDQLKDELNEVESLIRTLQSDVNSMAAHWRELAEQRGVLEAEMLPAQQNIAAMLPPELSGLDAERGRLEERAIGAERLKRLLLQRNELSQSIDKLEVEMAAAEAVLDTKGAGANMETAGDALSDGMNTYVGRISANHPDRWDHPRISLRLREKSFSIFTGSERWQNLGATHRCLFFLAYHFGLLALSPEQDRHYPGMCILDFPPDLAEKVAEQHSTAYLIDPFRTLFASENMAQCQLIVAGQGFGEMSDTNQIDMPTAWK